MTTALATRSARSRPLSLATDDTPEHPHDPDTAPQEPRTAPHTLTCQGCGHGVADHVSAGTSWPHPPRYGVCIREGCECSAYDDGLPVLLPLGTAFIAPYDSSERDIADAEWQGVSPEDIARYRDYFRGEHRPTTERDA